MSRLAAIRSAERPKMHGRAMLSGPSGAGKTWTGLGIATHLSLAEERPDSILVIDTERESALTYADVFKFEHLPWRPPYDPGELADALDELGDRFAVVIVDSLSKFWRGKGGTLDIADGKFGGWKSARPVQDTLVESILAVPAHMILCVRSKMEYVAEGGHGGSKQTVTKIGLAPIQDDDFVYEMNVAFDIDLEHRMTVTKSRTPAVPVGRMFPAGMERKAAEDYAAWLAGGIPPAARADVEAITARFAEVGDAELRKTVKKEYVERFGMPHSLTASQVADATAWLTERLGDTDAPETKATPPADDSEREGADDGDAGTPPPASPSVRPEGFAEDLDRLGVTADSPEADAIAEWSESTGMPIADVMAGLLDTASLMLQYDEAGKPFIERIDGDPVAGPGTVRAALADAS